MTRLEQMVENLADDMRWLENSDSRKDAITVAMMAYLRKRNDFIASKLAAEQAVIGQAAANEFDIAESDETEEES